MKNIWTIARRDFRSYFTSPIAYIIIAAFLAVQGWMFFFILRSFNEQNMQAQAMGMGKAMSITEGVVQPLYGNMNVLFLFLIPFITMRLFAEERKLQTLQLLLTSPVSLTQIILGKFLSGLLMVISMMTLTLVYPIVLYFTGNPDLGPIVTCYLGTLFLAACLLSVGILFSAMTENQIVAGALTFAATLFLWLISWAAQSAGPVWSDVWEYLSLINHYRNFGQGIINTSDVFFYISFIFTGLFLTHRVLDSYRWR